jgi:preprotein translocase subunit YajC
VAGIQPIVFMLLMFAVFWFILIRPQAKRQKEHQAMLAALQKGDTVITRGGLIGKVSGLSEQVVTLELQEKVRVRVMRTYIEGKHDPAKLERASDSSAKAA